MQHLKLRTIVLIGAGLTAPLIAVMYLAAELTTLPFIPADFLSWLRNVLPTVMTSVPLDLSIALLLLLGLDVDQTIVAVGQAAAVLLFFLLGLVVTGLFFALMKRRLAWRGLTAGLGVGAVWGATMAVVSLSVGRSTAGPLMLVLWPLVLFLGWGLALGHVQERLVWAESDTSGPGDDLQPSEKIGRRQFLLHLSAGAALVTLAGGALGRLLAGLKARQLEVSLAVATSLENPDSFPTILNVKIYPSGPTFQFPELQMARYQPGSHPLGVCFSGGGPRSLVASLGQMRGLHALGLLDDIGAISAVSGGAWFNTIFCYAPTGIGDATLLGPILNPTEITPQNLAEIDPQCIAAPLLHLTSANLNTTKTNFMIGATYSETQAFNRVFARLLNDLMLKPFHLDDTHTFFTLDAGSIGRIIEHNPGLTKADFYTMRPNRPFLIIGAANVYPLGENQVARSFEYTPLYSGTPQLFKGAGIDGTDIGGGYVESLAFDSLTPSPPDADNYVTVTMPNPIFLLSDIFGSTGAAPGIILDQLGAPEWFPRFSYWPVAAAGAQPAATYSFIDGSGLENTGIVPLLRRQYPLILAFINSRQPVGATGPATVDGLDHQVARLFGLKPQGSSNDQDTQIFPSAQFKTLADGLRAAKANGQPAYFIDSYPIVQPNAFDIPAYPAYPGNGEVTVMWFYNELNPNWQRRLSSQVQALLASTDPTNYLANFPNLKTYFQNHSPAGIPQLLQYTPEQINLLAHMWTYTVMDDAGEAIQSLKEQFS